MKINFIELIKKAVKLNKPDQKDYKIEIHGKTVHILNSKNPPSDWSEEKAIANLKTIVENQRDRDTSRKPNNNLDPESL